MLLRSRSRSLAQIQYDYAEPASVQNHVGRFEGVMRCRRFARTHNKRRKSTPAREAESGSKAPRQSTTAQNSPRALAAASKPCKTIVLPERHRPNISLIAPFGRLPYSLFVRLYIVREYGSESQYKLY